MNLPATRPSINLITTFPSSSTRTTWTPGATRAARSHAHARWGPCNMQPFSSEDSQTRKTTKAAWTARKIGNFETSRTVVCQQQYWIQENIHSRTHTTKSEVHGGQMQFVNELTAGPTQEQTRKNNVVWPLKHVPVSIKLQIRNIQIHDSLLAWTWNGFQTHHGNHIAYQVCWKCRKIRQHIPFGKYVWHNSMQMYMQHIAR